MFSHPLLARSLAFRGGTVLYKLYLSPAARYSEDIDLVQVQAGPAGAVMDAIQATLNPWLGKPRWKQTPDCVTFRYSFESGGGPSPEDAAEGRDQHARAHGRPRPYEAFVQRAIPLVRANGRHPDIRTR